jgi:hypothetical protein
LLQVSWQSKYIHAANICGTERLMYQGLGRRDSFDGE